MKSGQSFRVNEEEKKEMQMRRCERALVGGGSVHNHVPLFLVFLYRVVCVMINTPTTYAALSLLSDISLFFSMLYVIYPPD